jgi:hypothetical protein
MFAIWTVLIRDFRAGDSGNIYKQRLWRDNNKWRATVCDIDWWCNVSSKQIGRRKRIRAVNEIDKSTFSFSFFAWMNLENFNSNFCLADSKIVTTFFKIILKGIKY